MKSLIMIPLLGAAMWIPASAAPHRSAEVTTVVNDVRIYRNSSSGVAAGVGDRLAGSDDLHTGRRSRAELMFPDKSMARVGANSIFSFRSGSRDMEIKRGSFLLQVPKDAGGATIRTATVTAAITGTTTMMEYNPGQWIKFITLEGTAKLRLNKGGEAIDVPPGQMVFMRTDDNRIPRPIMINIQKLVRSSKLTGKDFKPLDPDAEALVDATIRGQNDARNNGEIAPAGVIVSGPSIVQGGGRDPDPATSLPTSSHRESQSP